MGIKILLLMVLLHILDDFHLQGILRELKQKKWWLEQKGYKDLYKNDYIMSLMIHSMQWSIMVSLPLFLLDIPTAAITMSIGVNAIIHYYVDDLKCNKMKINLVTDQTIHLMQICLTWAIFGL